MKNYLQVVTILLTIFIMSCEATVNEQCNSNDGDRGHIVSVMPFGTITKKYLSDFLIDNNIDIGVEPANGVKVYSITYETIDWDGNARMASGAIYIPDLEDKKSYPIYSGHHGTESKRSNVASMIPLRGFDAMFVASVGYIGSSADFLGLGVSDDVVHPYIHAFVAEGVVDMIRATKNWLCSNEIENNDQLFLTGYSEGGYVTMATHKLIEEQYADEFIVTASAPLAGPHDLSYFAKEIISADSYPQPGYISFAFMAYNTIEKLNRAPNELFQSPYASRITDLMDGTKTIDEANAYLTNNIKDLLTEKYIADYLGDGERELKAAFKKNSLVDWAPQGPIKLFHGDADEEVFYENSVRARDKLKANGADIELVTIPGGSHSSSVFASYGGALTWFNSLKK